LHPVPGDGGGDMENLRAQASELFTNHRKPDGPKVNGRRPIPVAKGWCQTQPRHLSHMDPQIIAAAAAAIDPRPIEQ